MKLRSPLFACIRLFAVPVLLCAGFMVWMHSRTTYYVSAYRVASVVDSGSNEEWRHRLYPVDFKYCTLEFEWYTYDNPDIDAGPYKLFMVVWPNTPRLDSVKIVSMQIESNRGTSYALAPPGGPVLTASVNENFNGKTAQSLAFDFDAKEEITTTMVLQFELGTEIKTETLTLRWKPVRVRYWSSIV